MTDDDVQRSLFERFDERQENGVRRRMDGGGDAWAQAHRDHLGTNAYLSDLDGMFGLTAWAANTGERLFQEIAPDDFSRSAQGVREFAWVSFFDRKQTFAARRTAGAPFVLASLLCLCRILAGHQPRPPRFFYVIGGQTPPWSMLEVDIWTADEHAPEELPAGTEWRAVWERNGLAALRRDLSAWVRWRPPGTSGTP